MTRHWLVGMTRLQIIFVVLLPLCSAQFSIKGPTDGNRQSQGLRYSQEKGLEYEDQRASLGAGDFSIQGATDGNSDFQIQGATDGNANFQIQGATDGNANFQIQGATDGNANFQIQGATDSNADFRIQGPTDANADYQPPPRGRPQSVVQRPYADDQLPGRALQYRDPSGLSVNWKSYHSAPQHPPQHALQPTHNTFIPQDAVPQQAPAPRYRQPQRQHAPAAQPAQEPQAKPNYRSYANAPAQIKQLLQFQQQIPYLNIIPEQYRYDAVNTQPAPAPQPQQEYETRPQKARNQPDDQNQYRSQYRGKSRGPPRSKRQTNQRQGHQQPQQRVAQAPAEPQPHYSTSVPSRIQELLKFQSQIPYVNHIPEQWRYDALAAGQEQKQEITYQIPKQAVPARSQPHRREKRQAPQQQQSQIRQYRQHPQQQQPQQQPARQQPQYQRISQPPPEPQPQYSTNLPSQLQQLLKFQAQIPYVNSIPEKFRYENLLAAQGGQPGPVPSRQKRQAQYQQHQQQQSPRPQQQPQYQRISQPPPEPQPQYSTSLPASIQKILQFQSQTPYNIIANQITYRLDKPYVPQSVQAPQAAAPQYQQPQQPAASPYRAQGQPQAPQSYIQRQGQPSYGQAQNNVRPVTENQY